MKKEELVLGHIRQVIECVNRRMKSNRCDKGFADNICYHVNVISHSLSRETRISRDALWMLSDNVPLLLGTTKHLKRFVVYLRGLQHKDLQLKNIPT